MSESCPDRLGLSARKGQSRCAWLGWAAVATPKGSNPDALSGQWGRFITFSHLSVRPPMQAFSLPGPLGLNLSHRNSPGIPDGLYSAPDDPVHGLCCTREPCLERIGFGAAAGRTLPITGWVEDRVAVELQAQPRHSQRRAERISLDV